MKKFRIAVQLPIEIYLEVEADNVEDAYNKVRDISPIRKVSKHTNPKTIEIDGAIYEDDGHKILGSNVSMGQFITSQPAHLCPIYNSYEVTRNEARCKVASKDGFYPMWVNANKYSPRRFHEILVKVPALMRIYNLYHDMDQKDPTSVRKIPLWDCLRKVLSVAMIRDLQTCWYNPHLDFTSFDHMNGVGDKRREKIKKFSEQLEGSEEFERLMSLKDKGE